MTSLTAVVQAIQIYSDGLYEGDTQKLASIFHHVSHLYSLDANGQPKLLPRGQWLELVAGRPSPKSTGAGRTDRIVSLDFVGPTLAVATVNCSVGPNHFTDALTFLKTSDAGWQIVAKAYFAHAAV